MLWLFDSRDRLYGKRELIKFPYTYEGKRQAWDYMLKREFDSDTLREDYFDLRDSQDLDLKGQEDFVGYCEVFNDYWACYGWCLQSMEHDAEVPSDCEEVSND